MTTPTMPFKSTYKPRKNRSKSDSTYENDLFNIIKQLLEYAYTKRNFKLNHRSNRNSKRNTNLNIEVHDTSIIDLMKEFLLKKDLFETYNVPQDLKFYRKFYNSYTGTIKFSTLYTSFRDLTTKTFQTKFPNINFESLFLVLQGSIGLPLSTEILKKDYEIIQEFISKY